MSSTLAHDPGAFDAAFDARPEAPILPFRPDAVLSGWPDFDAMEPLRPGRLTLVDAPRRCDLVDRLYADAAVQGSIVLVADGANSLDAYHLAAAARRRAVARLGQDAARRDLAAHEEMALDRVRVARGFTVHQLQAIVEDGLPREAARAKDEGLAVGLVAAPGLLDMSLDADVQPEESRVLAERAIASLRALARDLDVPVLVTGGILLPGTVHPLRAMLEGAADEQVDVRDMRTATLLDFPRRGARFVIPGRAQRRLNDFAPGAVDARPTPAPARPAPMGASYMNGRLYGPRYGPAASWIQGARPFLAEPAAAPTGNRAAPRLGGRIPPDPPLVTKTRRHEDTTGDGKPCRTGLGQGLSSSFAPSFLRVLRVQRGVWGDSSPQSRRGDDFPPLPEAR